MLVRLHRDEWSDFVDTDTIGMVVSWKNKEVEVVFTNGTREHYWIWNLVELQ
jgi:hypothetical protein